MHREQLQDNETAPKLLDGNYDNLTNILDFPSKLKRLRSEMPSSNRESLDSASKANITNWQSIADSLDNTTPNWNYSIDSVSELNDMVSVIASISIDGVSRSGVGTAYVETVNCIEVAERQALMNAAMKFGLGRHFNTDENSGKDQALKETLVQNEPQLPENPVASTLSDLITSNQLRMIKKAASESEMEADEESNRLMFCNTNELSRSAAEFFIAHLRNLGSNSVDTNSAFISRAA